MLSLMYIDTYRYFIQMLLVIIHSVSLLITKMLRNMNMAIGLEKLSMVSLPAPLVFTSISSMGLEATTFYKCDPILENLPSTHK